MTNFQRFATVSAFVIVLVGVCTAASAQEVADRVTPGETEVLAFVGGVTDGGGLILGGGIHHAFESRWLLVGELGYLTGGQEFQGFGVDVDSDAISVDANVHYLFPLSNNEKFTPYALGGLGFLRVNASTSAFGITSSVTDTQVGFNIGGGARWQRGERWGVRPELKILIADNSSVRFSVGLYYGFGS